MKLDRIFKPEYFYQPKVALKRLLPFQSIPTAEFIKKQLPWGMDIRVRPLEEHGKILHKLGVIDLAVTETLWRLAQPGELVVDVGANIGYMSSVLAARVSSGDGGCVCSFEAHPEIFTELKHNVHNWQQQLKNTQFIMQNIAISEVIGKVTLNIPESFSSNRGLASVVNNDDCLQEQVNTNSKQIFVESCDLDHLFTQEEIGVLKLDVEGHELQVLKGAVNLIKQGRIRDCIFEEHLDYPSPVTTFFESRGYQVFRIQRKFKNPVLLATNSNIPRTWWQPTSFIATRNPERAMRIFQEPGWQVLSQGISSTV
jgi:FkbM family methyltransferase